MTASGWYPDPSGEPNRFRFWDGSSWSNETTGDPTSAAPGQGSAPSGAPSGAQGGASATDPYQTGGYGQAGSYGQGESAQGGYDQSGITQGGYGQPGSYGAGQGGSFEQTGGYGAGAYGAGGYQSGGFSPGGSQGGFPPGPGQGPANEEYGRPKWLIPLIAIVAVLLIVGGVITAVVLTAGDGDDNSASDDKKSSSVEPSPTDSDGDDKESGGPTDGPSATTPGPAADFVNCEGGKPLERASKSVPGKLSGGGITATLPSGYTPMPGYAQAFSFGADIDLGYRPIEDYWISTMMVGKIQRSNGFISAKQATHAIVECMTRNDTIYSGFSSATDVHDKAMKVDGKDAWSYRTKILVDDERVQADGDVAEVLVVDLGDGENFAFFIGVTPIGDAELLKTMDTVVASIKVS